MLQQSATVIGKMTTLYVCPMEEQTSYLSVHYFVHSLILISHLFFLQHPPAALHNCVLNPHSLLYAVTFFVVLEDVFLFILNKLIAMVTKCTSLLSSSFHSDEFWNVHEVQRCGRVQAVLYALLVDDFSPPSFSVGDQFKHERRFNRWGKLANFPEVNHSGKMRKVLKNESRNSPSDGHVVVFVSRALPIHYRLGCW